MENNVIKSKPEIIETTMGDLKEGDLVYGTDGYWHPIKLLDIHTPRSMYKITFEKDGDLGSVDCSGDHKWRVFYDKFKEGFKILTTEQIFLAKSINAVNFIDFSKATVGTVDGPKIQYCQVIPLTPSRCITVLEDCYDSDGNLLDLGEDKKYTEHQFEILMDNVINDFGDLDINTKTFKVERNVKTA